MWAKALAADVPDRIFWETTPREFQMLWREMVDLRSRKERARQEAADFRMATLMAEIRNQWVPKGKKPWTAERILKPRRKDGPPDWGAFIEGMQRWTRSVNKGRTPEA